MVWLRACLMGLAVASAVMLGACGNREPEARAAFLALLQDRTEAAAGEPVALPPLNKEARQALGDYAPAYDVMADFQAALRKAAQPMREVLATETLRSVGDIVARRDALTLARKTLEVNASAVREARAKADKARAALELPPDVAPIYDGLYDESLTAPATELLDAAATLDAVAVDALAIADFVAANAAQIELADGQARVATPTLLQALNPLLAGLNARSDSLERARAQVRKVAESPVEPPPRAASASLPGAPSSETTPASPPAGVSPAPAGR